MGRIHLSSAYIAQPRSEDSASSTTRVPLYMDAPFDLDNVKPEDIVYEAFLDPKDSQEQSRPREEQFSDVTTPSNVDSSSVVSDRSETAEVNPAPTNVGDGVGDRSDEPSDRTATPTPGLAATTDLLSIRGLNPANLPYLSRLVDRVQEAMSRARPEMERAARTEESLEHRLPRVEAIFRPHLDEALLPFRDVPEIDYVGRLFERFIVLNAFGHEMLVPVLGAMGSRDASPEVTTTEVTSPMQQSQDPAVDVAVEVPVKVEEGSTESDVKMSVELEQDLDSDTDFSDVASDPGFDEDDLYMQDADIRSASPSIASSVSEERPTTPFLAPPPSKHEVDLTRWWIPSRPTSATGWSRASSLSRCQSPFPRSSIRSPMSDTTSSEEEDLQSPTSSYCIGSGQLHPFFAPAPPHFTTNSKRSGHSLYQPVIASPSAFKLPSAHPDIKIVDYANV